MSEATSIATIFEDFGLDHAPDGWPPVKQMHLTAAAAELRRLEAQLQKETAARQAAQIEAEALKERLVRADAEKCAAVLAERIAPNAPVQEPVHKLIYPGGGKALFNRLWHLTCNAVATQSGMRVRTDVMPMREMKEFLDHLCVLVDSPPLPAPVQEPSDSDYATIAGLEASIGHLSRLVDEQRQLLVRCADDFGVDSYGIQLEDGDSELIDKVREMVATTSPSKQRCGIMKLTDNEILAALTTTIGIGYRGIDKFARAIEKLVRQKAGLP